MNRFPLNTWLFDLYVTISKMDNKFPLKSRLHFSFQTVNLISIEILKRIIKDSKRKPASF